MRKTKEEIEKEKLIVGQTVNNLTSILQSNLDADVIEALDKLRSICYDKKCFEHYSLIIQSLRPLILKNHKIFDLVWKVIRIILRKNPDVIQEIVPDIIKAVNMFDKYDDQKFYYFAELGEVNPEWIRDELSYVVEKLKTANDWNDRRWAAFVVGSVGTKSLTYIQNSIPTLIEYARSPEKTTRYFAEHKEKNEFPIDTGGKKITVSISVDLGADPGIWLRDASIDALGDIGSKFPNAITEAIPLLEELARNASTPYSMKKAQRALEKIRGKN